jgi:hypothetical protein
MAPAIEAGLAVRIQIVRALFGRNQETHCVSPPVQDAATKTVSTRTNRGQRPPGAGRALAGGFGPPAGLGSACRCGRGDGPCHGNGAGGSESVDPPRSGRDPETHCVSPARATLPPRPVPPAPTEASARPGGREAPAGPGRALAGGGAGAGRGLWAPGGREVSGARWQGRWPLPGCARARGQKSFPRSGQAAHAAGTSSAPC